MDEYEELERALMADGEKLRALTGEDHGPWVVGASECPKCGAVSGDDWSQCEPHRPCPMGGPWALEDGEELPPTFEPEEPAEVAELREQLATAREDGEWLARWVRVHSNRIPFAADAHRICDIARRMGGQS